MSEEVKDELNLDFIEGSQDDPEKDENKDDVTGDDDKSGKDPSQDAGEEIVDDPTVDAESKKKGGVQKKIDKLTKRMRDLERDNIYLRGQLDGQQKISGQSKEKEDLPAKLSRDDYDTDEEYFQALNQQNLDILEAKNKSAAEQKAEREAAEKKNAEQEAIDAQFNEGRQKYDDFDEVALNPHSHNLTREMFDAANGDNLADILYVLGKNPGVSNKIAALSATQQIKEIGKIEARIEKARGIKPKQKTPEEQPVPHLKSVVDGKNVIKDVKDMTMSERMAHWDAERETRLKKNAGLA